MEINTCHEYQFLPSEIQDSLKYSYCFFCIKQVWTQKCAVQKASVDVNISYY